MSFLKRIIRVIGCCLILISLLGCNRESLYQNLSERDANEMLVVLYRNGISAKKVGKTKGQETSYEISVPKSDMQTAQRILVENNLPRRTQLGFAGICKEKGLVPTPEEEKCRKLLAMKGEIINVLEKIPGVIEADVVLNIPEVSEYSAENQPAKRPTASAVLRVQKDQEGYEVNEARIQRFISNSVENLDPRDISVIISYITPPQKVIEQGPNTPKTSAEVSSSGIKLAKIAGLVVEESSLKRFKIYSVVALVLLIAVSAALILNVVKVTSLRQELKVFRVQAGTGELVSSAAPPLLEGGKSGEPHLTSNEQVENPQNHS